MARRMTAAQMAANWQRGFGAAGVAYTNGTAAVVESPMAKAAANLDKAAANYQASVSSGRMAAALNAVPVGVWKSQCALAGKNLAVGAAKGLAKITSAFTKLTPIYDQMTAAGAAARAQGLSPSAAYDAAIQPMLTAKANGQTK